jgi:alkaline phosphatase
MGTKQQKVRQTKMNEFDRKRLLELFNSIMTEVIYCNPSDRAILDEALEETKTTHMFEVRESEAIEKGKLVRINKKELEMLEEAFKDGKLPAAARQIINNKSGVGWTTGAHTALPVLTTCYGKECERFSGFLDNTDIGKTVKKLYKSDD